MKKALITGINGQDGSYLAELLLDKGYEVHGLVRRDAMEDPEHRLTNITNIIKRVKLHVGAIDNHLSMYKTIALVKPDECYHLASSSFVSYNFEDEASLVANNFMASHALLAAIKELVPECRVYFAGSSEMFGDAKASPQNELTPFNPRSVYGISKLAAFHLARNYREHHKLFVAAGILYNHESPRRGHQFVTRKITTTVAKIYLGMADRLELGNIEAQRDWGFAPDYVKAMHMMLQLDKPEDFVISTGVTHSVKDFLIKAFSVVDLDYKSYTHTKAEHFRPGEAITLCGDASKAHKILNWTPKVALDQIIEQMVFSDIEYLRNYR
ncbi:hypothetical protein LCGC14_1298550 [marine sediment metagenome]|uniref:GDP-mannose 4,6-dehydratase n=1 Tax=marine sediment metagenome TaxID=412755 RepID=A0A0F9N6Y1_9ZZZZ